MALDARHRSSIYRKLVPVLGDDDANALMSEFPDIEADDLVTKQFLRAEVNGLQDQMHTGFADARSETQGLRGEMHAEFANVRREAQAELADLRSEMHTGLADAHGERQSLRGEMQAQGAELGLDIERLNTSLERKINHQTVWLGGLFVTSLGVLRLLG